ncbi:hypothetical protein BDY21DRAFT_87922 [Lineolata rhizophorae]|uniref:Histone lysine methyltransferase SET associated domain-containing protein n=1 Tax=Lineolata rhizophorae TaxID=578093 RepID=A0A6A6PCC1_9PEZI|nr:hypothetical protein BDY21DRAFT_87922 [Lineolata rhizophorae]
MPQHLSQKLSKFAKTSVSHDDSGYYIWFNDDAAGKREAYRCYERSHRGSFFNYTMHMDLFPDGFTPPANANISESQKPNGMKIKKGVSADGSELAKSKTNGHSSTSGKDRPAAEPEASAVRRDRQEQPAVASNTSTIAAGLPVKEGKVLHEPDRTGFKSQAHIKVAANDSHISHPVSQNSPKSEKKPERNEKTPEKRPEWEPEKRPEKQPQKEPEKKSDKGPGKELEQPCQDKISSPLGNGQASPETCEVSIPDPLKVEKLLRGTTKLLESRRQKCNDTFHRPFLLPAVPDSQPDSSPVAPIVASRSSEASHVPNNAANVISSSPKLLVAGSSPEATDDTSTVEKCAKCERPCLNFTPLSVKALAGRLW